MTTVSETFTEWRDRMVGQYAYLCRRGARRFMRPGIDRADLEQVAALGLLKACHRYNAGLNTPFEAYAWLFIIGELMHYVRDYERLVRPPRRLRQLDRLAHDAYESLVGELGRAPTRQDIAEKLGVRTSEIEALSQYREQASFEPIDASRTPQAAMSARFPSEIWDDRLMVQDALQMLNDAERSVVLGVYAGGFTQIELARRLGYSRRHISRLHRGALNKMRPAVTDAACGH